MELTNPEIGINHSVPNAVMGLSINLESPGPIGFGPWIPDSSVKFTRQRKIGFGACRTFGEEHSSAYKKNWRSWTKGYLCSKSNSISRQSKRG